MKLYFLVLAYNEEDLLKKAISNLLNVIKEISWNEYEIIIVNDGSTDNTQKIALDCKQENNEKISVIKNEKNIGGSKSIQNFLKKYNDGKLIVITGDNDMHTNLIRKLILNSKDNDFIISYYINREVKGYLRAMCSYFYNFLLCSLFGVYAFYLQGPFVWPIQVVKNFDLNNNGVTFVSEINVKLLKSGLKFVEVSGLSNVGSYKSTAISIKNILKSIITIFHLINEIYINRKYTRNSIRNNNSY